MTRVRIGSATWDIGPAQETPLLRSRPPLVALWVRTGAVLTLTGTLALTGIVSTPKAEQAREETVTEASAPKDAAQIAAWVPPQPRPEAKAEPVDPLAPASVFAAELSPVAGRFGPAAEPPAETTRFAPWTAFTAAPEWREEEFGDVQVVDGRTLQAGSWRIQLIGLDLPMAQ